MRFCRSSFSAGQWYLRALDTLTTQRYPLVVLHLDWILDQMFGRRVIASCGLVCRNGGGSSWISWHQSKIHIQFAKHLPTNYFWLQGQRFIFEACLPLLIAMTTKLHQNSGSQRCWIRWCCLRAIAWLPQRKKRVELQQGAWLCEPR